MYLCVFLLVFFFVQLLPSHTKIYPSNTFTTHTHTHTLVASALCCGEVGALCKKIISAPTAGSESHETAGLGSALLFICCLWASVQL